MAAGEERRRRESEVHLQMAWQGCWRLALHCVIVESYRLIGVPAIIWPCSLKMALLPLSLSAVSQCDKRLLGVSAPVSQRPISVVRHTHTWLHTRAHTGKLVNIVLHTLVPVNSIRRGAGGLLTLVAEQIWSRRNVQKKMCLFYFE